VLGSPVPKQLRALPSLSERLRARPTHSRPSHLLRAPGDRKSAKNFRGAPPRDPGSPPARGARTPCRPPKEQGFTDLEGD
jgi:hypothetical protein